MKPCDYCGRKNEDSFESCTECGSKLLADGLKLVEPPAAKPNRFLIWGRRGAAVVLGLLFFAVVAPEFSGMSKTGIVVWTALPLAPMLCVFLGSGRIRFVEAFGWAFFGFLALLLFAS
jgi:hypothetical protein